MCIERQCYRLPEGKSYILLIYWKAPEPAREAAKICVSYRSKAAWELEKVQDESIDKIVNV